MRVRGGNTQQNLFLVDGFNMSGFKTLYKSVSSVEVSTAGYGADGAIAPGGLVSMVTKGGSNKYELDVNGFHEDSLLRFATDAERRGAPRLAHVHQPELLGADHQGQALVLRQRRGPRRALLARRRSQRLLPAAPDPALLELPGHHQAHLADVARATSSSTSSFWSWDWSRNRDANFATDDDAQRKRERTAFYQGLTFESLRARQPVLQEPDRLRAAPGGAVAAVAV